MAERSFDVDRSVHQVDAAGMLERQAQSAPEALQETTGVLVQATNRGAGAPILRGLIGPQNLILVDGIRFSNSTFRTGPNQYLTLLDPASLDRVEVLLGPGSVLYGSDAMGGVVQAMPIEPWSRDGPSARAGTRIASADRSTAAWGTLAWQQNGWGIAGGGAWRRFDMLTTGGGAKAPLSDYSQGSWHLRLRGELLPRTTVDLTWLASRLRDAGRADELFRRDGLTVDAAGLVTKPGLNALRFYDNDDDLAWLSVRHRTRGWLREVRLALSLHRTSELGDRFRCDLGQDLPTDAARCLDATVAARDASPDQALGAPLARHDQTRDTVWTPGLLATAHLGGPRDRLRATAGIEAYADEVDSSKREQRQADWAWKYATRGNFSDGSTWRSLGAFAHADLGAVAWGDTALVASAGGRLSIFAAHADGVPGVGAVDYQYSGFVGTAGLRLLHRDVWMAYLSFSQGFRAPNLQETTVLGDTGSKFEVPNADLRPESSDALELGVRLALSGLDLHVAGFVNLLSDAVDEKQLDPAAWTAAGIDPAAVPANKPVIQRVNASQAVYRGAEATVRLGPFHGLVPWLQAAWLRGDAEDAAGTTYPARRVPPPLGGAGVRYERGGWHGEVFVRAAAGQDRLHPSDRKDLRICEDPEAPGTTSGDACQGTPGWATLNARGGWGWAKGVRVDVALTNLTDERYRTHGSGLDAAGLGASLSVAGEY